MKSNRCQHCQTSIGLYDPTSESPKSINNLFQSYMLEKMRFLFSRKLKNALFKYHISMMLWQILYFFIWTLYLFVILLGWYWVIILWRENIVFILFYFSHLLLKNSFFFIEYIVKENLLQYQNIFVGLFWYCSNI